MTSNLVLNGRFLGRAVTGVERLGIEISRAILERDRPGIDGAGGMEILTPSMDGSTPDLDALVGLGASTRQIGQLQGHAWEQVELRGQRPDQWLLSPCNIGPILRRKQAIIICDAQFILHPESYSRAFRTWYRVALPILGRRAARVFTISQFSKGQLERFGVVPKGKAEVLRLGADHMERISADPATLERHGLAGVSYILAIGSLAKHKNIRTLIRAFAAADIPGVRLVLAGGARERVFQDIGLEPPPNVLCIGRVTDEELKALYAHARAFAIPSLSEGFGLTPLEAMTVGCPVLATTGGAVPEVCGEAAIYADPTDEAGWTHALRRISGDAALRADLGRKALERAATFKWSEAASQILRAVAH